MRFPSPIANIVLDFTCQGRASRQGTSPAQRLQRCTGSGAGGLTISQQGAAAARGALGCLAAAGRGTTASTERPGGGRQGFRVP